ncbi:MAG: hypothetical protein LBG60_13100 [Bifidobacteriaceae bacterium]|jgi:hypothetical protein|nr:hypothetical protein [Bifidobacteriaceae bacterium]
MTLHQAALAGVPNKQRAEYASNRPAFEVVETADGGRIAFADWLDGDEGRAWLAGGADGGDEASTTPLKALLEEALRQEVALSGAARRPAIRLNVPVEVAQALLEANTGLAWVVGQLDRRRDIDPDRPSPTALTAALLACAMSGGVQHVAPDITWQAARRATEAAAKAAEDAAGTVGDLRELLEHLGAQIASATAQAASEVALEVSARVADAAVKARASDERAMLRLLASLVAMGGGADPMDALGSDAATRVENAARGQAAELLATDLGRAGRL